PRTPRFTAIRSRWPVLRTAAASPSLSTTTPTAGRRQSARRRTIRSSGRPTTTTGDGSAVDDHVEPLGRQAFGIDLEFRQGGEAVGQLGSLGDDLEAIDP